VHNHSTIDIPLLFIKTIISETIHLTVLSGMLTPVGKMRNYVWGHNKKEKPVHELVVLDRKVYAKTNNLHTVWTENILLNYLEWPIG